MIKNDFRYIIKKIIIGIGIFIGIFYFKSCNVNALEDTTNMEQIISNYNLSNYTFNVWFNKKNSSLYATRKDSSNNVIESTYLIPDNYKYIFYFGSSSWKSGIYLQDVELYYLYNGGYKLTCRSFPCNRILIIYNTSSNSSDVFTFRNNQYNSSSNSSVYFNLSDYSSGTILYTNENIYNQDKTYLYQEKNLDINLDIQYPEIESLQYTLVTSDNDYGSFYTKAIFRPKFSVFDTDNFNYYYQFNNGTRLKITENEQLFTVAGNGTVLVSVYDKDNNYITSETFTVTGIGSYISLNDDFIHFTYILSTNDKSDVENKLYTSEAVSISFDLFDLDKFEYYYDFLTVGEHEEDLDYKEIPENFFSKNYTENGRIYVKVVQNGRILVTDYFDITEIGNESNFLNQTLNRGSGNELFDKLNKYIDYGGPISNIVLFPSQFLSRILTKSNSLCSTFSLGSFKGKPLSLECINLESKLGTNLWHIIDILIAGFLIIRLSIYFRDLYNKLINVNYDPNDKKGNGGDMV